MFGEFLEVLDDFLVGVVQSAYDRVWLEFGWSRRILASIAVAVSIGGLIPLMVSLFQNGTGVILVLPAIMSAWIITKINAIYLLLAEEWQSRRFVGAYPLESNFQGSENSNERKITLVLSVAALPIVLASMTFPSVPVAVPLCFLSGGIGNLFSVCLLKQPE